MPQLYALLVGINEYPPESRVRNLRGCENDVNIMETFLNKYYGHLLDDPKSQIKKILNQDATRENLLQSFPEHLSQAKVEIA